MTGERVLRVLVVEDSAVARKLLTAILDADPGLRVVGEAPDGAAAVALAKSLRPDVITMDIHMPVMNGIEATREIMQRTPTPIVVVTASSVRDAAGDSFGALAAGAVTVVERPAGPGTAAFARDSAALVETVKLMAEVKVVTRRSRRTSQGLPSERLFESPAAPAEQIDIVAMAASTGGPAALASILRDLPADTPVPILIVQHITPGFEGSLATWLDETCSLRVRLASGGERLQPGDVLIAPSEAHLGVDGRRTAVLTTGPPVGNHCPSATHLFRSVADAYGARTLGVILTGMGSDGAQGLLTVKQAGGWVVAQDEATSVVYGMPKEAVALGVVDQQLSLAEIPQLMLRLLDRRPRRETSENGR